MAAVIEAIQGDIATLDLDAIVNAANTTLLGGGGGGGAIHRAAGLGLLEECRKLRGCPTGEARITGGHRLKARHVIHAVGPVWHGGTRCEDELLAGCYRASFALATRHSVRSISFPAISTGIYRFPRERACRIAVAETRQFTARSDALARVVFCCFDAETLALYRAELER